MHFGSEKTDLLSSAWKSLEGIKTDINKMVREKVVQLANKSV